MASVLFSTVGQAIGGPLGAAVGAVIGGSVDSAGFGSRKPGMSDFQIQRSAYGDVVPRIFGRTRVAGQLIWAQVSGQGGGKGSGRRQAGASFAIVLSSGPIQGIGRIWADGREIRNADGQFESRTVMRIHQGGLGQEPDPLILSTEGETASPDYRGLSYVVFENLDLNPFGNRIPNLSFEVLAGETTPADWLRDIVAKAGIAVETAGQALSAIGYSALGGASEEAGRIAGVAGLSLNFAGGRAFYTGSVRHFEIGWGELLEPSASEVEVQQDRKPASIALTYLDEQREYLASRQHVSRGRSGLRLESEVSLCASAGVALALAGRLLREAEAGAESIRFGLSWKWLDLAVGDHVSIGGRGPWRIRDREIRGPFIYFRAQRVADPVYRPVVPSDPGRGDGLPMIPAGPSDVRLIEAPVPLVGSEPALFVWLGGGAGWRGATAQLLVGGTERNLGEVRELSARGQLIEPLRPGPETMWDMANSLLVAVEAGLPDFETRSENDVLSGANLVLVGEELLQYRNAEMVAEGIVRLSGLLRGRYGTAALTGNHGAGEVVRQIVPERLLRIEVSEDAIGRELVVFATGRGDPPGGSEAMKIVEGCALAPMAPVHLRSWRLADGSIANNWMPRAPAMWPWSYPGEARWQWIWTYRGEGGQAAELTLGESAFQLSVAEQIALSGAPFGPGVVTVEAMGEGSATLRMAQTFLN